MTTKTKRERKYPRVQISYAHEPCITDQAAGKELTMPSIVAKLEKGIMPNLAKGLVYSSDLGVRNLQDVVQKRKEAEQLFNALPTDVKRLMKNDIKNFEEVLFNEKNRDVLEKHNLFVVQKDNHKELISAISGLRPQEPEPNPPKKTQKDT